MPTQTTTHQDTRNPPGRNAATTQAIRATLAARRLTTTDLANHLGISRSSASRRLTGHKPLTIEEVGAIAEWLGVPYGDLLTPEALARPA